MYVSLTIFIPRAMPSSFHARQSRPDQPQTALSCMSYIKQRTTTSPRRALRDCHYSSRRNSAGRRVSLRCRAPGRQVSRRALFHYFEALRVGPSHHIFIAFSSRAMPFMRLPMRADMAPEIRLRLPWAADVICAISSPPRAVIIRHRDISPPLSISYTQNLL